nr:reverse transcriptase domain-containing protein [Tanacetum cinerariifolium]
VVQIVLWYLDSGCSKHMTGNRSQLMNFVSKNLGRVRFENDHIARIMGLDKLAKDYLARGIPRLKLQKDHLCLAYALGKSKKSSHQPKVEDTNQCMRTRRSYFSPTATIPRRLRKQTTKVVELEFRTIVEMADNRTMAQMLQAPIEGYEDAIVVPTINANNFQLKQMVINFVQSNQFTASKTTYLQNEITNFLQKPNETFNEAWERFKDLLRQNPHHGFSELHQLDTFYNALNPNDQDALDSAAGGNFLDKISRKCLSIIESKSKVRYSRSRVTDSRANTNAPLSSLPSNSFDLQQIAASLEDKLDIRMNQPPILPLDVEQQEPTEVTKDTKLPSTKDIQPLDCKVEWESVLGCDIFLDISFSGEEGGRDFDSEENENFLNNNSIPIGVEDSPFNMEEDILFLESLLREEPCPNPPMITNQTKSPIKEPKHSFNMGPFIPIHIVKEERIRREHAEYINRMEMLFTIKLRSHPLTYANTNVESISSLPIPVHDNDSQQEKIDVVTKTDDLLPPSVENDDPDEEVDVVDVLRVDNSISNYEHEFFESADSDFDNPSVPLPPPEPPDKEFDFEIQE